jgi:DNA-binding NarL/FixJ family response regulator
MSSATTTIEGSAMNPNPSSGAPIKIVIVDDSATLGRNIERWLNRAPGFKSVGVCASGEQALALVPEKKPDVVLMDIQMPGMNGVECTAHLKKKMPALQIIMLTVYEDTETIFKALRAGASGYLLKRSSPADIIHAIRDIRQGGAPMTSAIARKVVEAFQEPAPQGEESDLTMREREILDHLAKGFSNKEIGARLDISPFTVKAHLARIFEKLHVRSRTEAVMAYLHPGQDALPTAPRSAAAEDAPPRTRRK